MTKETHLAELAHHLKKLPKDDYQNAMAYYTEYFDEAGPENEAQVTLLASWFKRFCKEPVKRPHHRQRIVLRGLFLALPWPPSCCRLWALPDSVLVSGL